MPPVRRELLLLILVALLILGALVVFPPDFGPWLLTLPYRP